MPTSVRWVPTSGINTRALRNVPARLPAVESAYRRPATFPASATLSSARRSANGDTAPSAVTGRAKRATAAKNDPTTDPTESASRPCTATSRSGRAAKGVTARDTAARRRMRASTRGSGLRSASFPPSQ